MTTKGNRRVSLVSLLACLLLTHCATTEYADSPARREQERQALVLWREGQLYFRQGDLDQAIEKYQASLKLDGQNAIVYESLGLAYSLQGEYEQARETFLRGLEHAPYHADFHNDLGVVYKKMGDYDKALEEFRQALQIETYHAPEKVYFNIATVYYELEEFQRAYHALRRAARLRQDYHRAYAWLGLTLEKMDRMDEAMKQYQKAVELDEENPAYRFYLGKTYYTLRKSEEAREQFDEVLLLAPESEFGERAAQYIEMLDRTASKER